MWKILDEKIGIALFLN